MGFSRGLAAEVGRDGITVNCIALGTMNHGQLAAAIVERGAVALDHLVIGHQVMPECYRLGGLQMREAGHRHLGMGLRLGYERLLQPQQPTVELVEGVAHEQPEVERHLIVARARRV